MMKKSILAILLVGLMLMPIFVQATGLFSNESTFLYSEDLNKSEIAEAKRILNVDDENSRSYSVNIDEIILGDNVRFKNLALLYIPEDNEEVRIEIMTPETISESDMDLFFELMRKNNVNQGIVYLAAVPDYDEETEILETDQSIEQSNLSKTRDISSKVDEVIDKEKLTDVAKKQWGNFVDYLAQEWKIITDDSQENPEEWKESIEKGIAKFKIDKILDEEQLEKLEDLINPKDNSIENQEKEHGEKELFIKTFWSKLKEYGHRAWTWIRNFWKD